MKSQRRFAKRQLVHEDNKSQGVSLPFVQSIEILFLRTVEL